MNGNSFVIREDLAFVYEKECPSGIRKIADKVAADAELVFGKKPVRLEASKGEIPDFSGIKVVFGIAGNSPAIERLSKEGRIDLSGITGKREVYGISSPAADLLVIAGSDKRGTIYGLFRLSEEMGVSPFVNWSGLKPGRLEQLVPGPEFFSVSKEPSVEYRGFFINDEWPAFGTWCNKHFGGFTAEMYESVFELLLRLKGNYLWPAMWTSSFAEDGPGLKSAELADELGVVMGLSHHEPCLRHGEEYSHVRGKDSIYGDAWNFRANQEGITRFWRDGLKRNGHLENVITVGMRGERDSKILGRDATLKDNIDLLRDVLRTQEKLIREEVNEDLTKVPRMLALYKEVEAYYYGDETTPGLIEGCPELEDVILLLCEDNHGYLRSLPDERMRQHPGGFGMYYHFDYHGDPVSFEWINSTYLPEVWQQMSTAYEYGVRKLWIVNVGDLAFQELPLSYFLDLAYDYDTWGQSNLSSARDYQKRWMEKQFSGIFSGDDIRELSGLQWAGSRLIHNRRPEHMSDTVYHPREEYEADRILAQTASIRSGLKRLEDSCPEEYRDALFELIGYSLLAGCNLIRMHIFAGLNHYYASIGAAEANHYAQLVRDALAEDRSLKERLQSAAQGKWDGFAEAPHIGFTNWNMEESKNPILHEVIPVSGKSLVVGPLGDGGETHGMDWTKKLLTIRTYDREDEKLAEAGFFVALCGDEDSEFEITKDKDWLGIELPDSAGKKTEGGSQSLLGTVTPEVSLITVRITVDKARAKGEEATISVKHSEGCVRILVKAPSLQAADPDVRTCHFLEENGRVVIDADHFAKKEDGVASKLLVLSDLGRRESALGLFPLTAHSGKAEDAPYAEYVFRTEEEADYDLIFQMLPTNAYTYGRVWNIVYTLDDGESRSLQAIPADHLPGESADWAEGVLSHKRDVTESVHLLAGDHRLRFCGTDAENVLERILLIRKDTEHPKSYLGPAQSRQTAV